MSRVKQNIIILQEKALEPYDISMCAGNMYMNRLCINEEAGFEFSGVYCLKEAFKKLRNQTSENAAYQSDYRIIWPKMQFRTNYNYQYHHQDKPSTGRMVVSGYEYSSYSSYSNMTAYPEINDETVSHSSRFVSFDNHINENDDSQGTELTHVTQAGMDQRDMSKEEEVSYGLADNQINENDYSQGTELNHVTQAGMDQRDMSKEEEISYGLAKQERKEKGNHFQIAKNIVSHIVQIQQKGPNKPRKHDCQADYPTATLPLTLSSFS